MVDKLLDPREMELPDAAYEGGELRVVDKLLDPREIELPDAAYEGARLADDPRYGNPVAMLSWPRHWQCMTEQIQQPRE